MRCATLPNGTRPASHCQKDPTRPAWNPFEAYCPPGDGSSTAGQTQLEDAPGFTMSAAQFYADDKLGGHGPPNPFDSAWTSVPVEAGDDQASVKIDLAGVNGTVVRPDLRAVLFLFLLICHITFLSNLISSLLFLISIIILCMPFLLLRLFPRCLTGWHPVCVGHWGQLLHGRCKRHHDSMLR